MPGIEPIYIPLKADNLTIEAILPYLPYISDKFNSNAKRVIKYRSIYENKHNIFSKERRYADDTAINNKVSTPHLWAIVNFKSGYALGNPKEYSLSNAEKKEDLKYLNIYCKDSKVRTVDKDVITEVYAVGNCYYFIEPKSNLSEIDPEYQSPFNIWCRTSDTCAKIYSSYNGNEELFDILVTKLDESIPYPKTVISIYLPDVYYEAETTDFSSFRLREAKTVARALYKKLPLVEKYSNKGRIGLVEIGETLQNAIDVVYSNEVDNIEDVVNRLMIFKNQLLGDNNEQKAKFVKDAKHNGAIEIFDSERGEADVFTLDVSVNHSDILSLVESLESKLYSACGAPLATSDTSNGGNKAGALQLGNGWESAHDRFLDDVNSFVKADYEVLDRELFICRRTANSRIKKLMPSDIDVKYNPNMSDNMLTKAQAYKYFRECNIPHEVAIMWTRLSNDPLTMANIINEYNSDSEVDKTQNIDSEVDKTQKISE